LPSSTKLTKLAGKTPIVGDIGQFFINRVGDVRKFNARSYERKPTVRKRARGVTFKNIEKRLKARRNTLGAIVLASITLPATMAGYKLYTSHKNKNKKV